MLSVDPMLSVDDMLSVNDMLSHVTFIMGEGQTICSSLNMQYGLHGSIQPQYSVIHTSSMTTK